MSVPVTIARRMPSFAVRVVTRAGRTAVGGTRGDALVIRLAAPPVDGAANEELITFLSELFERPERDIQIISGQSSRDKRVAIAGVSAAALAARLDTVVAGGAARR